eukprot:449975_1
MAEDKKSNDKQIDMNEVALWLRNTVRRPQYIKTFNDAGFEKMTAISQITDTQLKELGIHLMGHRNEIMAEVKQFAPGAFSGTQIDNEEFLKMKMKISLLEEQVRNAQRVAEEQKEGAQIRYKPFTIRKHTNDKDATFVLVLHGEKIGVPLEIKNYSDVNSLVSQCKLMMGLNETDELKVCTKHHKHDDQLVTVMPHDVLKPGKIYYAKRMMCFAALMVRHLNQEHFRQSVGKLAREHGFGGGIERNSSDITSYRLHLYSPNKTQLQQFLEVTLPKVANVHSKWSIVCAEEQRERAMFFPFQLHAKPNEEEYSTGRKCMNTIQKAECMMKTMKHNNGTYQTNTNGTYQTNTNGTYQTNTNGRCH